MNEVRIYQDPITQQRFEGSARVLRVLTSDHFQSYCKVKFLGGPPPHNAERWVDNEQLRTACVDLPKE